MKQLLYFIICLFLFSNPMFSQETEEIDKEETKHPLLDDKYYLEAGIFFPSKNVKLGADASLSDITQPIINDDELVDWNGTFDLNDNQATLFANFEWRWNKKWRLTLETFAVNNGSSATLDSTIVFDGATFEKGTFVRGGVEFALYRVFVGRLISSGQKHSLGAGLGVHALNIGAFIEGEIKSDIPELDGEFQKRRVSALIPLPNIGGWYHWAPNEKWGFIARVDWFGITIDKYGGSLWNLAPGVRYQIIKNFGIGIDYRFLLLSAKVSEENWKGEFNMDFNGPSVTLHGNF